ncbi:MAG: hypothetical protein NTX57_02310 [Armatimonadetes bacterium]|nr:hypothetical protein [Armatimonadota bacterium]
MRLLLIPSVARICRISCGCASESSRAHESTSKTTAPKLKNGMSGKYALSHPERMVGELRGVAFGEGVEKSASQTK